MYREEFEDRLERAKEDLVKLKTKVDNCDIDGILMASGEVHRRLIDARMSWRQASHKETTHDESGYLQRKLEAAESEFDDMIINFELKCKCEPR